jgi:hypothetical protein
MFLVVDLNSSGSTSFLQVRIEFSEDNMLKKYGHSYRLPFRKLEYHGYGCYRGISGFLLPVQSIMMERRLNRQLRKARTPRIEHS